MEPMRSGVMGMFAVAVTLMVLTGCSRIEEPWVANENQLQQERARPDEQQKQLRDRLMSSQIDR